MATGKRKRSTIKANPEITLHGTARKPGEPRPQRSQYGEDRLRRFAVAWLRYGNNAMAYRQSAIDGAPNASTHTATSEGFKMLHDERTARFIARLREEAFEKASTSLAEWIFNELRLARFDPARLFDEHQQLLPIHEIDPDTRAALQSIEIEERAPGLAVAGDGTPTLAPTRIKKVKAHSKDGSQERLARYLGAYEKDNKQQNTFERLLALVHGRGSSGSGSS